MTTTDPIAIRAADPRDAIVVAMLVTELLLELAPEDAAQIDGLALPALSQQLLGAGKIQALLAFEHGEPVAVLTLHECAALYAGGRFGEISELYVRPAWRASGLGQRLIDAALDIARQQRWQRLEVGAPAGQQWQRSRAFYQANGFVETGPRLRRLID
ncbi:GNAT family N-acetyltransferase [Marinobacterium arenosum]|uniref:GNAT family N-acetyltransferase n=1 Tax=Marinobacterium arenosum TaxID=2862496 RepID=UPI001C9771FB|nr:GNAT family N-acetyltransferase [Marinobacterium arenosum]MBY4678593.1 GNAT family N-acetyltransferase [Marinobacterium arenosum]